MVVADLVADFDTFLDEIDFSDPNVKKQAINVVNALVGDGMR